eukprot:Hpha_TRINITY_DN16365_c1_g2::TRINITY_DN16365_c1_g2_i2::g.58088::m.58088
MGEVQLFVRHGDKCLPVTLPLAATVGDLMKAAQDVASLKAVPAVSYQGEVLNDPSKPVADVGLSNQSTLELITSITVTVGPHGVPRELGGGDEAEPKQVELSYSATLDDLIKEMVEPLQPGAITKFYLSQPDMEERPLPSFEPRWKAKCVELVRGTLREQGVQHGSQIFQYTEVLLQRKRGRGYTPGSRTPVDVIADATSKTGAVRGAQGRAAELYVEQAGEEQTSVASFAALTLRLMANGAPGALLDASLRAGQDEVRHARACVGLAETLGGAGRVELRKLPEHNLTVEPGLAELATSSVREGGVGESIAATCALVGSEAAQLAEVREAQGEIAEDEARHAALAWVTAAWAAETGGVEVRSQLGKMLGALKQKPHTREEGGAKDDAEQLLYGHVEGALKEAVIRRTEAELIIPILEALAKGAALPSAVPGDDAVSRGHNAVLKSTHALLERLQ